MSSAILPRYLFTKQAGDHSGEFVFSPIFNIDDMAIANGGLRLEIVFDSSGSTYADGDFSLVLFDKEAQEDAGARIPLPAGIGSRSIPYLFNGRQSRHYEIRVYTETNSVDEIFMRATFRLWSLAISAEMFGWYNIPGSQSAELAVDPVYMATVQTEQATARIDLAVISALNQISVTDSSSSNTYTVEPGDTVGSIAAKFFPNNPDFRAAILLANSITNTDAIVPGKELIIPSAYSASELILSGSSGGIASQAGAPPAVPLDQNVIPREIPLTASLEERQRIAFGTDIATRANGGFAVGPSGDIATVSGIKCLAQNLLERVISPAGILPLHPRWGSGIVPGEMMNEYMESIMPNKIVAGLREDGRVSTAEIIRWEVDGSSYSAAILISPRGNWKPFILSLPKTKVLTR